MTTDPQRHWADEHGSMKRPVQITYVVDLAGGYLEQRCCGLLCGRNRVEWDHTSATQEAGATITGRLILDEWPMEGEGGPI